MCWQFGRQARLTLETRKKSPLSIKSGPKGRALVLNMPMKGQGSLMIAVKAGQGSSIIL